MKVKGKLASVTRNWKNDNPIISFEVTTLPSDLEYLSGCDALDITAQRHREKRSLNANSYFHVLVTRIAQVTGQSNTAVKNRLIREYGFYEYIDGKIPTLTMKAVYEDDMNVLDGVHVKVISRDGDTVRFGLMRGSHTYDTKEMSRLIEGTVEEAKELGIETMTPDQIKRMMMNWRKE